MFTRASIPENSIFNVLLRLCNCLARMNIFIYIFNIVFYFHLLDPYLFLIYETNDPYHYEAIPVH